MSSDRRGTDKRHPGQNLPNKRPLIKPPGQKSPRTIEREFVQGAFVRFYVLGLLKIGGYFWWGTRDVWQSVTEGGMSKLAKISVTYSGFFVCKYQAAQKLPVPHYVGGP